MGAGITHFGIALVKASAKQTLSASSLVTHLAEGESVDLGTIVVKPGAKMAATAAFEASKGALAAGAAGAASAGTSSALLSGINWSGEEAYSRYEAWANNWGAEFVPSYQNTGLVSGVGNVFLAGLGIPTEANYLGYINGDFEKIVGYRIKGTLLFIDYYLTT